MAREWRRWGTMSPPNCGRRRRRARRMRHRRRRRRRRFPTTRRSHLGDIFWPFFFLAGALAAARAAKSASDFLGARARRGVRARRMARAGGVFVLERRPAQIVDLVAAFLRARVSGHGCTPRIDVRLDQDGAAVSGADARRGGSASLPASKKTRVDARRRRAPRARDDREKPSPVAPRRARHAPRRRPSARRSAAPASRRLLETLAEAASARARGAANAGAPDHARGWAPPPRREDGARIFRRVRRGRGGRGTRAGTRAHLRGPGSGGAPCGHGGKWRM